jgi:hypothetical protein
MQEFINRKNREHYRLLLAGTTLDEGMRKYVMKLLAEEEAKELPPRVTAAD